KYQISNPSLLLASTSRLKSFIGDPFTVALVTEILAELMSTIAIRIRFCEPATLMTALPVAALAPSVTAVSNTGAAGQEIVGVIVGVAVEVGVSVGVEVIVGVGESVAVEVTVGEFVGVPVQVIVGESVKVLVMVEVSVGVAVGELVGEFVGV